jgi:LAS superfamily LD-carboxypeptidase LdcB
MPAMRQPPEFTLEELTGQSRGHVREVDNPPGPSKCALHKEVAGAYVALRAAAAIEGIDLVAFSGFRDFDRQLGIWNGKFRGERPMQDRAGRPLDVRTLTPAERVTAILWWSALPGTSRHHWGTDFDVMDAAALPAGYKLQVVPAEYRAGGPFERLTNWLDGHMHAFGFYRPYATDRGGVSPEPWHLSYAPVAARALSALDVNGLRTVLAVAEIEGKMEVLAALDRNFTNYVVNIDPAPQLALNSPRLA